MAEPLGGGPTGEVFRAKVYGVAGFERQFAVKRFHAELVRSPEVAAQLAASTRMYGSLEHPRIARLHEYGVAGGETFTATELVEGIDASRLLSTTWGAGEPLLAGAAAALVSQIARAIGYAHGRGISHLGLCPTNLVCTVEGDVKVTDFGVLPPRLPARPGNDLTLSARIPYLAPEQLVGEETSSATDVFQLGAVAYELFTGQRCFSGASGFEIAQLILSSRPSPPTLPRPLVKVIERCLARSPFERYPDAGAMADALDAAVRSTPLPGAKRDIASAVQRGLEAMSALHSGQISGALSFPLPAPPSAALMAGGAPARPTARAPERAPEGERPSGELTGEGPTIPRKTMMGGVAAPFKIPSIPAVATAPEPVTNTGDEAPTRIRDRGNGMLQPRSAPASATPGLAVSPSSVRPSDLAVNALPEIELSMNDLELSDPSRVSPLPTAPPRPPSIPSPPGFPSAPPPPVPEQRRVGAPDFDPLEHTPPPLFSQPPSNLPEVGMMPLRAEPELPPTPVVARKRGLGLVLAVIGACALVGAGVAVYFLFIAPKASAGSEVAQNDGASAVAPTEAPTDSQRAPVAATSDAAVATSDAAVAAAIDAVVATGSADASEAVPTTDVGEPPMVPEEPESQGDPGKLTIESVPKGAMVYVDGTSKGKTPITIDGVNDKVSIAVVLANHKLYTTEIAGTGLHKVTLEEVSMPAGPAGIKVRCHTKNRYYVFVDGNDVGQLCPTERLGVEMGKHVVEVYDPETEQRHSFPIDIKQTRNSVRVYVD